MQQRATTDEDGGGRPVNLQVGHGVRPIANLKIFLPVIWT